MDPGLVYGPLSKPFLYHDLFSRNSRRPRARARSQLPRSYIDYRRASAATLAMEASLKGKSLVELREEKKAAERRVREVSLARRPSQCAEDRPSRMPNRGDEQRGRATERRTQDPPKAKLEPKDEMAYVTAPDDETLYLPESYSYTWNTKAYLECFYETKIEDPAMQMVMFYLPNFLAPLPRGQTALDFGAGPTVHVAMMLRAKVNDVHLADFLPQNQAELAKWRSGESTFNWETVARIVSRYEGRYEDKFAQVEEETRRRVTAIHFCDMFKHNVLPHVEDSRASYDFVTTFFCVEYSCLKKEDYMAAIANIFRVIKPGGYFIMGGVMEVTWCSFGGRCFASLFLTKELLFDSLKAVGVDTSDQNERRFKFLHNDGMFMVRARKPHTHAWAFEPQLDGKNR